MNQCPSSKLCGGCPLLGLSTQKQEQEKRKQVQNLVSQSGLKLQVEPVLMAEEPFAYRNKIIAAFAKDKNKRVYWGLYAAKSHKVVPGSACLMQPKIVNEILDEIASLVQSMKIELYNPKTRTGLLRHVLIRWGAKTDQIMVVFVMNSQVFPSRKNMVTALTKKFPQITTILQNVNSRDTSIVLQNDSRILYGKGMITDELCGLKISFTASSFYQIHHDQCEVLYNLAARLLNLNEKDTVLDTYCGVGTIGLYLADKCKSVLGVEINPEAIQCARLNAKQNDVENIRFLAMDSTKFMENAARNRSHFDAIILDPPRAGATREFIESACRLNPKKILYISCDPSTQMRDLKQFKRLGYTGKTIHLVDMFPNTAHIESVVLLTKDHKDSFHKPYGRKPEAAKKAGFKKPAYQKKK